jgi:hypothetical protein
MTQSIWRAVAAIAVGLTMLSAMPIPASAIPSLQLDIQGGVYDPVTDTVVAQSDVFTLYAYLIPDRGASLYEDYFISAALAPKTGPSPHVLGSFVFGGTPPVTVTEQMFYGNPPIDAVEGYDPRDVPPHGIFETYFSEFQFRFSSSNRATAYNTQDSAGSGPTPNPSGSMYFTAFVVDVAGLADDYALHFDLYNTSFKSQISCTGTGKTKTCTQVGDIDVNSFAPFSHDAESGSRRVPEPSSLILIGVAMLTARFVVRRSRGV